MITDLNKKVKKITVDGITMELKPKVLGGEYNLESILLEDGTQRMVATFVGAEGQDIEVELPEEFSNCSSIYYFVVDDNTLLFAGYDVTGVFEYDIKSKIFNQLVNSGSGYRYFQLVNDYCLITSGQGSPPILVYSCKTKNIIYKFENSLSYARNKFQVIGDNCLIGSTSSNSSFGILLFESSSVSINQIYDTGCEWQYFNVIDELCFIGSDSDRTDSKGILLYDNATKNIEKIYENGAYWDKVTTINNYAIISSAKYQNSGGVIYNFNTRESQLISSVKYNYSYVTNYDSKYFISGTSTGLYCYDENNNTITTLYTSGGAFSNIIRVQDGYIAGGSITGLLYISDDLQTELIYSVGSSLTGGIATDFGALIGGANQLLRYDNSTHTVTVVGSAYYLRNFLQLGNRFLISASSSSSGNTGLYVYDSDDNTFVKVAYIGLAYKKITPISDNEYILEDSQKIYWLKYNNETKTARLVKYYIGKI